LATLRIVERDLEKGGERSRGGVFMNSTSVSSKCDRAGPIRRVAVWFARLARRIYAFKAEPPVRRVLFLDDDPRRAEIFLAENPQAVWVETVTACVSRLLEQWDEVHLDHDLGGQQMVGSENIDCGMEVIRWLCKEPREHLRSTLFFVHTHNLVAALLMVMQIRTAGFTAEFRPFGQDLAKILAHNEPENGKIEESGVPKHWIWGWLNRPRVWPFGKRVAGSSSVANKSH
jgi:hypothetical protein